MDVSFYGGRQGKSFVIVKNYKSVEEMNKDFQDNPTEVGYGEYVLISSPIQSLNNLENGLLFRRDLNKATYIGRIAGPPGISPKIKLYPYDKIYNASTDEQNLAVDRISSSTTLAIEAGDLIPGYDANQNKYNDNIELISDSVRIYTLKSDDDWEIQKVNDENVILVSVEKDVNGRPVATKTIVRNSEEIYEYIETEETVALFGVKIPYHVLAFKAKSVSPYDTNYRLTSTNNIEYSNLVSRVDDATHPFYSKWDIKIPHGIKGDSIQNIRVVTSSNNINGLDSKYQEGEAILVGDIYNYDNSDKGTFVTYFLSYFNDIANVILREDGTIVVDYTGNKIDSSLETKLTWLTKLEIDQDYNLKATFNNAELRDKEGILNQVHDLGKVKSDHPVAIGQIFSFTELGLESTATMEAIEAALNLKSPNGLLYDPATEVAADAKFGYLAAVGDEGINKQLYSFVTWITTDERGNQVENRGWKYILTAATSSIIITSSSNINLATGQIALLKKAAPARTDWPIVTSFNKSEILSTLEDKGEKSLIEEEK